jgi:hypothetical protein
MPNCSPLFVDKIALTIALNDETARDNISEWFIGGSDSLLGYEVAQTRGGRFYSLSKKIVFDEERECSLLVEFDRRAGALQLLEATYSEDAESEPDIDICAVRDARRPFRIEFNPTKLRETPEHYEAFLAIMGQWFGAALSEEMCGANITRIDLATDVWGINVNRLVARRGDTTVSSTNYGRDGSIQTLYLGAKNSSKRFVIYDKREQQRGRVIAGRYDRACTRIEVRLKQGLSLTELRTYANPFDGLVIGEIENLEINVQQNSPHYWDWLVAASKQAGLEATLNRIQNSRTRATWRRRVLERAGADWWNPDELWGGLRQAIDAVGLFPPETHIRRTRG